MSYHRSVHCPSTRRPIALPSSRLLDAAVERLLDRALRLGKSVRPALGTHVEALGVDELHVGDADEAEQRLQVRFLVIERNSGSCRVNAASGLDHDGALVLQQAFGALFA